MVRMMLVLVVFAGALFASDVKTKPTEKQMTDKMISTHRGDSSPYAKAEKQAVAQKPNWEELAKHVEALLAMSTENLAFSPYTANRYSAAVTGLKKAVADKSAQHAAESFAALKKSCSSCHVYGGATPLTEAELRKDQPKK